MSGTTKQDEQDEPLSRVEDAVDYLRSIDRRLWWLLVVMAAHAGLGVVSEVPMAGAWP